LGVRVRPLHRRATEVFVDRAATEADLGVLAGIERAGLITLNPSADKWQATQKDIVANPKLVATFQDPAVQEYLATNPSVKEILLPL
jgi:ABC-type metal ion transport system substrate-binding protein